jgi:hypothetical protein
MGIFSDFFITKKEKESISKWTYKVYDQDILSAYFDPFYNKIVDYIPKNFSANILSFIGFLFSFSILPLSLLLIENKQNNFKVGISLALCTIAYFVFDAIDGKYARKTKTSSQLGELIDHFF